jgi:tryptophanyl-tRNA synthetase
VAASVSGSAGLKAMVTEAVNDFFAPIRARRAELARDPGYLRQVLGEGNDRANQIADATLAEVRAAMGTDYALTARSQ